MPNFDAGHYFLTVLAPVRMDSVLIDGQSHARRHLIREVLAAMPAGEATVASQGNGNGSPFARGTRTHFVRIFVLDDVVFNGRIAADTLLKAQPVDRLTTPFLIFIVDFDADSGGESELNSYLTELWNNASAELTQIFQHCVGFEGVTTAQQFRGYIGKCQVETTMPFNDYWSTSPALTDLSLMPYLAAAGAGVIAGIAGLALRQHWLVLLGMLVLLPAVYLGYRKVMDVGQEPFPRSPPPGPGPDLPTVLKALYLQRAFTDLAIGAQGQGDRIVFDSFGAFIEANRPDEIAAPTQEPGVIGV